MDATIVLNLATLAISLTALVISILLTLRQIRVASGGNHLPVVLDAFRETRSAAWFEAQEYVLTALAKEHDADCGHRGLPAQARTHANTIGLFYDDLAKLVAHGMIDQSLVIGSYGTNIVRLWDALAPYVYTEREKHRLHFWIYFEDLAVRTAATHPNVVYTDLRLQRRPPRRVGHSWQERSPDPEPLLTPAGRKRRMNLRRFKIETIRRMTATTRPAKLDRTTGQRSNAPSVDHHHPEP